MAGNAVTSFPETGACNLMAGCWANKMRDVAELFTPLYILSIFLLSSWAREKVMRTITNNTTAKFRSDKIFFINRMVRNWLQISILFLNTYTTNRLFFILLKTLIQVLNIVKQFLPPLPFGGGSYKIRRGFLPAFLQ